MTRYEAIFRSCCLILSSMLEGAYHSNGNNGWEILMLSKRLYSCSLLGYDKDYFEFSYDMCETGYLSVETSLKEMITSTYKERGCLAKEILDAVQQIEFSRNYTHLPYESLQLSERSALLIRLETDREYRKLSPWEEAFYNRLKVDSELQAATQEEIEDGFPNF